MEIWHESPGKTTMTIHKNEAIMLLPTTSIHAHGRARRVPTKRELGSN